MRLLSQKDPRWAKTKIGKTNLKMSGYGCYITSVCMALEKFRGYECNPNDAAKFWTFDKNGYFYPQKTELKGGKYIGQTNFSVKKCFENTTPDKAAIVHVKNKNIKMHFVLVTRVDGKNVYVADPLYGKEVLLSSKYIPVSLRLYQKND